MNGAPQRNVKSEKSLFLMSHLDKLIREANKADQTFRDKQRAADAAAKRKAAIAEARAFNAELNKEIKALDKALAKQARAKQRKQAQEGQGVKARIERGGRAVEQLKEALKQAPDVVGKGRYYRPVPANIIGKGYYYKRRKRPYKRKGKMSIMQRKYYDLRRKARRSVYERAYRLANPLMDIDSDSETIIAKFERLERKRSAQDRSGTNSDRSTPDRSPPRLAIKLEDLGSLLTY